MTTLSLKDTQEKITTSQHDTNVRYIFDHLRSIGGLCNSGEFDAASSHLPLKERGFHGDATDKAILRFSEGLGEVSYLQRFWKDFELAFNSKKIFMVRTFSWLGLEGLRYVVSSEEECQYISGDVLV